VRLLTALNSFKLEVPAWILKVEGELKAEWERENARLKRGAKGKFGKDFGSYGGRCECASRYQFERWVVSLDFLISVVS
jgi:hypothetical protein